MVKAISFVINVRKYSDTLDPYNTTNIYTRVPTSKELQLISYSTCQIQKQLFPDVPHAENLLVEDGIWKGT